MFIDLINNSHNYYHKSIIIVIVIVDALSWVIACSLMTVWYHVWYHVNGLV